MHRLCALWIPHCNVSLMVVLRIRWDFLHQEVDQGPWWWIVWIPQRTKFLTISLCAWPYSARQLFPNSLSSQDYNSAIICLDCLHGFCSPVEFLLPFARKEKKPRIKIEKDILSRSWSSIMLWIIAARESCGFP